MHFPACGPYLEGNVYKGLTYEQRPQRLTAAVESYRLEAHPPDVLITPSNPVDVVILEELEVTKNHQTTLFTVPKIELNKKHYWV